MSGDRLALLRPALPRLALPRLARLRFGLPHLAAPLRIRVQGLEVHRREHERGEVPLDRQLVDGLPGVREQHVGTCHGQRLPARRLVHARDAEDSRLLQLDDEQRALVVPGLHGQREDHLEAGVLQAVGAGAEVDLYLRLPSGPEHPGRLRRFKRQVAQVDPLDPQVWPRWLRFRHGSSPSVSPPIPAASSLSYRRSPWAPVRPAAGFRFRSAGKAARPRGASKRTVPCGLRPARTCLTVKKSPFPEREGAFSESSGPLCGDPLVADGSGGPDQLNVTRSPASKPSVASASASLSTVR